MTREEGTAYVLHTEKGSFRARYVVNAAGLYADDIAGMAGDRGIELKLTKGTMAILNKSCSSLVRHTLYGTFSGTHSQLVTPTRPEKATVAELSKPNKPPNPADFMS